jgi:hypothetical protein
VADDQSMLHFEALQARLGPLWPTISAMHPLDPPCEPYTVVVVPSISMDLDLPAALHRAYEERFLSLLFLLRQPQTHVVYVTSQTIPPAAVEYYLRLIPGVDPDRARERLALIALGDDTPRPLSEKLLARPRALEQIRARIADPDSAYLLPFNSSPRECAIAEALGLPMYAVDPAHAAADGKSEGRRAIAAAGVPRPLGAEDVYTAADVVEALVKIRAAKPSVSGAVLKLDHEVAGRGNALVDLAGLPPPGDARERESLGARLQDLLLAPAVPSSEDYLAQLAAYGGVVEELIGGPERRSPCAELWITPAGGVELLSTHDQLLGGPIDHTFVGARFPADPSYAPLLGRLARQVAAVLARQQVIGHLSVDFVAERGPDGAWQLYALEINLRSGGTTHPFFTLQQLTAGRYDAETDRFATARGEPKSYVAVDHLEAEEYWCFSPEALIRVMRDEGLHFDATRQRGVVLHMLSAPSELGTVALTAIDDDPAAADTLYREAVAALDRAVVQAPG